MAGIVGSALVFVGAAAPSQAERLTTTTAQAVNTATNFTPKAGLIFNNPKGSKTKQYAIVTQIDRTIDAAPKGSTIRMAQYLFDTKSTADKLIKAHKRGVRVQVLLDDGVYNSHIARVRAALGTNERAGSYLTTCSHSCMANSASVMHAKIFLFSSAGKARNVSMVSSGNTHSVNIVNSWNNIHTIVGDTVLYNSLNRYFTDMLRDVNTPNYFRTTTSGIYKLYYFPHASMREHVLLDVLQHVKCTKVKTGYGTSNHRTIVRVAMWGWTSKRKDIAQQLWTLHNRGCKVEVILNTGRTSLKPIIGTLLKKSSKYGQMKVYDAWRDKNLNDYGELYMHHKLVTINGTWFGKPTKVAYTGSLNFTGPGTESNNDVLMRVKHTGMYNQYADNFAYIRANYTKRLYKVPPPIPLKSHSTGDSAGAKARVAPDKRYAGLSDDAFIEDGF